LQATTGQMPTFSANMKITFKEGVTKLQFGGALTWESFSIFDVTAQDPESSVALRAQHALASHIRFGLYECTIQNATQEVAKGGLIASAQFPGRIDPSSIIRNPDTLFPYVSTAAVDSSSAMLFATGQHYFYRPEKVQDWLFKQITADTVAREFLAHDMPKIVTVIYAPPALATNPITNLKGMLHYEYLTVDRSTLQVKCPNDTLDQFKTLLAAMRQVPQFAENPSHWETIKNGVKKVVKSDTFRKIVTDLAVTGVTLLAL